MIAYTGTFVVLTTFSSFILAQTAEKGIVADPGVVAIRLIDRDEVRASRIEIQPGATRRVHSHTDVQFHLFVGIKGTVQLAIGSDKPIAVKPGEAHFLKAGTPHGFQNIGSDPAIAMEIFVKSTASPVAQNPPGAFALALMALGSSPLLPEFNFAAISDPSGSFLASH